MPRPATAKPAGATGSSTPRPKQPNDPSIVNVVFVCLLCAFFHLRVYIYMWLDVRTWPNPLLSFCQTLRDMLISLVGASEACPNFYWLLQWLDGVMTSRKMECGPTVKQKVIIPHGYPARGKAKLLFKQSVSPLICSLLRRRVRSRRRLVPHCGSSRCKSSHRLLLHG